MAIPISGTNIRLLSGVPLQNDYKHTRWFDNRTQQTNWFLNKNIVHSISDNSFKFDNQKDTKPTATIQVGKNVDDLLNVNYLMFQNTSYGSKWFYAFVKDIQYVNNRTSLVYFEIDVMQTWMFEMNFKPSIVVREHRPLWNSDGTPVINTIDEGLNYGTEYDIVSTERFFPNNGIKWMVIVTKTPLHETTPESKPTINGTPQPLSYYIHPFTDDLANFNVMDTGSNDAEAITPIDMLMKGLYMSDDAVNNVVSLYITEHTGIQSNFVPFDGGEHGFVLNFPNPDQTLELVSFQGAGGSTALYNTTIYVSKVERYNELYYEVETDKYDGFKNVDESKLLMYPYALTVVDDMKGNRATYKNEYIDGRNLYINMKGSLGLSNKTSVQIPNYNHENTDGQKGFTSMEFAMINNNPTDVPIINDYLSAYLQGNRNSIELQKTQIIMNGAFNLLGGVMGGNSMASIPSNDAISRGLSSVNAVQGMANTQMALQGIEAKQNDINNQPPQLAKMGSNTSFDFGNNFNGVFIIKKQIKPEYRKKLSDYFKMFGYKLNEIKIPNFKTRQNFNYIQTMDCVIHGNFNNDDLNKMKSVFNTGITLWHTDDIGNYNLSNGVR